MLYARFDSSDARLAAWPLRPTLSGRLLTCDAQGAAVLPVPHEPSAGGEPADALGGLHWLDAARRRGGGRWVGFLSYDLGRWLDETGLAPPASSPLPLYAFGECGEAAHSLCSSRSLHVHPTRPPTLQRDFTRGQYLAAVQRCKQYIAAGDIFQVNLSQRFTVGLPDQPEAIYQRLAQRHPATYGAFLDFGSYALICNSPELFLRVIPQSDGRCKVITRPIKGTRPRLPGRDVELRNSVKDQAELNMIIDLERNDLGRVCEIGTVKVSQPRTIEAHPTVYHGVATIEGMLRPEVTLVDLLRATFPGGSVTGAPKIRAMQIIDELEPVARGPYCGAIGSLAPDGGLELSLAIRTMIVREGAAHVHVGGGIVADSDPAEEYEETLVKARAMFEALGVSADE
jgi:anthranilate/para-aminobenzoate synthase component I